MVAPVSTYALIGTVTNTPQNYTIRYGQKQARPIDRSLRYEAVRNSASFQNNGISMTSYGASTMTYPDSSDLNDAWCVSRAYEAMREDAYNSAALGVDLAEYRQSVQMIVKRATQLKNALVSLRRGRLDKVADALGVQLSAKFHGKSARRTVADNWLELHFGWVPLIKDCHEAMEVATEPFLNLAHCQGKASDYKTKLLETRVVYPQTSEMTMLKDLKIWTIRCKQGAAFSVTNPNVALANQLGLLNPLVIAWEIVPFSFVVDWFVNVGQVMQGFSDFAGMTAQYQYCTRSATYQRTVLNAETIRYTAPAPQYYRWEAHSGTAAINGKTVRRTTALVGPQLAVRPLKLPSWQRAATAWSLVTQLLRK